MANAYHGVGVRDWIIDAGVTAYRDGVENAVSAAAGAGVANLETARRDTWWEAGGTAPGLTRALFRLGQRCDVGAVAVGGLDNLDEVDSAYRVRWGEDYAEKPAAGLVAGTTAVDITETASWTFAVRFKVAPARMAASTDNIAEVRLTGASSSSTRVVQVAVGATGGTLVRLERKGGAPNQQDFTAGKLDDGKWHEVLVSFADAGGGGGTATVYLDRVSLGTLTTAVVFAAGTVRIGTSGNHWVSGVELYTTSLSAAQVDALPYGIKSAGQQYAECLLNFAETSGVTIADAAGSHDLTLASGTLDNAAAVDNGDGTVGIPSTGHGFLEGESVTIAGSTNYNSTYELLPTTSANSLEVTATYVAETFAGTETVQAAMVPAQNPFIGHDGGVAYRWQGWRRRGYIDCVEAGAGVVQTAAELNTSPIVHLMLLVRFRHGAEAAAATLGYFGSSTTLTDFDWQLIVNPAGTIIWRANRHDAGSAVTAITGTTDLRDGVVHTLSAYITWGGAMSLAIDGVEEATGTAPAYTAASGIKLVLHNGATDWDIGMAAMSRRAYTHAQAHAILTGGQAVIPWRSSDEGLYGLWHMVEAAGTSIANRGTAGASGDLTISSSAASWGTGLVNGWSTAGAYIGADSIRTAHNAYEIAAGVNVATDEILVELYQSDPTATAARITKLFAYEVLWFAIGASSGQESWDGGSSSLTAGREIDLPFRLEGRGLGLTFGVAKDIEVLSALQAAGIAGTQWGSGGQRAPSPVMLVRRVADRTLWVVTCGVVIPGPPTSGIVSRGGTWTRSITITGPEVRYGQTA